MARKEQNAFTLSEGATGLLRGLYRVGVMLIDNSMDYFKIEKREYRYMVKNQLVKEVSGCIMLDRAGTWYCEYRLGMTYKYRAKEENIEHDLILSKLYLELDKETRETWETETKIRHWLVGKKKYKEMYFNEKWKGKRKNFIPDAAVTHPTTGKRIIIEAVTDSYSRHDIAMKKETAKCFFDGFIRIDSKKGRGQS